MNISSSDHILFHLHVVSTSLMRENVTNYFIFVLFLAYKVALALVTCVTVQFNQLINNERVSARWRRGQRRGRDGERAARARHQGE